MKNALEIINKIESYGFLTYIVGGFVRDYIMGKEAYDIDICTIAKPKEILDIFPEAVLPKEKYGAVTLYYKNVRYEITTFRKELKYENRRPVEIEYTTDFNEDIIRRDFTINSLCMDKTGNIIDLFNGKNDIKDKIIKTIGNANERFNEDPLRMLRAIRFATQLNFKLDNNVLKAIKDNAYLLQNISFYRKKEELNKIFISTNSKYGIKLLCSLKMDKWLSIDKLNKVKITTDILGIWTQLNCLDKYPFTNIEKDTINFVSKIISNRKINKYEVYKYGLYNATIAAEILGINKKNIIKIDKSLPIHSKKDIVISANEICKLLNKTPSKWLNELYKDLEYKILYSKLQNDNDKIKEYIIKNY